jgi:hypothetical protein
MTATAAAPRSGPDDALRLPDLVTLDAILERHRGQLAADFAAYRHHACRVATLCLSRVPPSPDATEMVAIAGAFHDLGIWVDGTFDYLAPSERLAREYLTAADRMAWLPAVTAAIGEHHRLTPYRGEHAWLVEPFRHADWMDVSGGLVSWGLSRSLFRAALARWPRAGFHRLLARVAWRHGRRHPTNPFPMLKL